MMVKHQSITKELQSLKAKTKNKQARHTGDAGNNLTEKPAQLTKTKGNTDFHT